MQQEEVCTVSSIVLRLTWVGHNTEFIGYRISLYDHLAATIRALPTGNPAGKSPGQFHYTISLHLLISRCQMII